MSRVLAFRWVVMLFRGALLPLVLLVALIGTGLLSLTWLLLGILGLLARVRLLGAIVSHELAFRWVSRGGKQLEGGRRSVGEREKPRQEGGALWAAILADRLGSGAICPTFTSRATACTGAAGS